MREVRPPFSPEAVVAEFAATLRSYRVTKVSGDRYTREWPREQFRKFGITYEVAAKRRVTCFATCYRCSIPQGCSTIRS